MLELARLGSTFRLRHVEYPCPVRKHTDLIGWFQEGLDGQCGGQGNRIPSGCSRPTLDRRAQ